MPVGVYFLPGIAWAVVVKEPPGKVLDKLLDLFILPLVLALVVVNGVPLVLEQLTNGLGVASDFFHNKQLSRGNCLLALSFGHSRIPQSLVTAL